MQKPPLDGMAIADSLYGSGQERKSDSKIDTPPYKFKSEQIKAFLSINFEAGRPMPDDPYERGKRALHSKAMAPDDWQAECKDKARRCGV